MSERDIEEISRNRRYLEDLLKQNLLNPRADLITHLFLLLNFATKSSSSKIYDSMKSRYDDKVIKKLLKVADGNAIKIFQLKTSRCATNDAFDEKINMVRMYN